MSGTRPSILIAYPSCFYYPAYMDRLEVKTSLLLLSSYLAQYFPIEYVDFELSVGRPNSESQVRRYERRVEKLLAEREFDILALSCWTSLSYQASLVTARICRRLYPDKLIIVGGYHPTAKPYEFALEDNLFDYVVCGEGEEAIKDVVKKFEKSGRPGRTEIIRAPVFPADKFIGCDWDLIEDTIHRHFSDGLSSLYIYLSRGCPFGCSFCMEPIKGRNWRAFSPEKSIEELKTAADKFGAYSIAISDACFGMRPAWRKEFLDLLVKSDPKYWIIFETRPEYLDEDDIRLMSKLQVEIQFGIESGSHDILTLMKKTKQPRKFLDRFTRVSHMLSDYGILHRANLIFNHPGETRKTLNETFAFIDDELKRSNSSLIWAVHGYMHFPGCELDTNMQYYQEKFGSRFLSPDWWKVKQDQYENSMKFVPSSDLDGDDTELWRKMYQDRLNDFKSALTDRAYKFAAAKYFNEWQYDARYQNLKKTVAIS